MAEAADNIKRWYLLAEYHDQKIAEGLSRHAAEHAIRREGHQRQFKCRCHNEAGHQVDPPANLWIAGSFDFATSWVSLPNIPDPLAPLLAETARKHQQVQASIRRVLGQAPGSDEDNSLREAPRRQDSRRLFVEVLVAIKPAAPNQAQAERDTSANAADRNPTVAKNAVEGVNPFRTGSAGRPSAKEIIRAEFQRRVQAGEVEPAPLGLAAYAETLASWWEKKRVEATTPGPVVKATTIRNMIRDLWKPAIADAQKPSANR
jgi:hypothetical protein